MVNQNKVNDIPMRSYAFDVYNESQGKLAKKYVPGYLEKLDYMDSFL